MMVRTTNLLRTLLDWTVVNGSVDYWFYDLELKDSWIESDDEFIVVYGIAKDAGDNESEIAIRTFPALSDWNNT